jgi:hypothetical protein
MTLGHSFQFDGIDFNQRVQPDPHASLDLDPAAERYARAHNDGSAVGDVTMWPESYSKFSVEDAAELSNFAYDQDISQLRPSLAKKVEYVPEKSDEETSVFRENRSGKYIVSYRGTVPTKKEDLGADLLIYSGMQNKGNRTDRAKAKIKELGRGNVDFVTAHSLGGNLADEASRDSGVRAITFAEGKSLFGGELLRKRNPRLDTYTTGVDPISVSNFLTQGKGTHWVKPTHLNVHGMQNYVNNRSLENKEITFH